MSELDIAGLLARIADSLERLAPTPMMDFDAADAFIWHADPGDRD